MLRKEKSLLGSSLALLPAYNKYVSELENAKKTADRLRCLQCVQPFKPQLIYYTTRILVYKKLKKLASSKIHIIILRLPPTNIIPNSVDLNSSVSCSLDSPF